MKTKELTNYQKKNIEKRKKLNFFNELNKVTDKKKIYSKVFSKQLEIMVSKLDNQGVLFYSFNIELPFLFQKEEKDQYEWEEVHQHVEEFINYIGSNVELVEFCYLSIELKGIEPNESNNKKKTFPYFNGLIGIRSIIGQNNKLIFELKDLFIIPFFDVKINWLIKPSEIIKYWNFIIKQQNFRFHRFVNYSNFYQMIYGSIADEELKFDDRFAFSQENHFISDTMNISGICKKKPKKQEIILYFLKLYLDDNDMILYNNNIYSKDIKSHIFWKIIFSFDQLRNNFFNIFDSLKLSYPQQLEGFDISELVLSDLDSVFKKINKNNNLLSKKVIFNNLIEFKDGIFFIDIKEFYSFEIIKEKNLEIKELKTIYYIDFSYAELNSSENCLKYLKKNLNQSSFDFFYKKLI